MSVRCLTLWVMLFFNVSVCHQSWWLNRNLQGQKLPLQRILLGKRHFAATGTIKQRIHKQEVWLQVPADSIVPCRSEDVCLGAQKEAIHCIVVNVVSPLIFTLSAWYKLLNITLLMKTEQQSMNRLFSLLNLSPCSHFTFQNASSLPQYEIIDRCMISKVSWQMSLTLQDKK